MVNDRNSKNKNREDNDWNNFDLSKLPMMAMDEIPTPNSDARAISALVKEGRKVTGYQLSDGTVLGISEAVALAKEGGIEGVGIASRKGNLYLKSLPDAVEANNLGNLPSINSH